MEKVFHCIIIFIMICLGACTEKPIDNPDRPITPPMEAEPSTINITGNHIEFDCDSNQYTFTVNANCDYDIIIPVDWVSCVNTKAMNADSITLVIAANKTYYPRKCEVIIQTQDSFASDTLFICQEEGFNSLAKALKSDKSISLFYQAMVMTGMIDSIRGYIDESFESRRLVDERIVYAGNNFGVCYLDTMFIKYTVFCETDSVLKEKLSINTIEDLILYSEKVYPNNNDTSDNDYTKRNNPLNQFVSYHIMPIGVSYEKMNPVFPTTIKLFKMWNEIDFEDYYTTMLDHSVLKVSTPYLSDIKYLNRNTAESEGISIDPKSIESSNGYIYHLTDILEYSMYVRSKVLNTRIRVLATTLYPEIMNNGGRSYVTFETPLNRQNLLLSYNDIYNRSFKASDSTLVFALKETFSNSNHYYMNEGIYLGSKFDIVIKIPPVTIDGLYEIRFRHNFVGTFPDKIQFYLNDKKCGDPRPFRYNNKYESIWINDWDLNTYDEINANDDSLRLYGYMKDVDSYYSSAYDFPLRDCGNYCREIICSDEFLEANKDYYLRLEKQDPVDDKRGVQCIKMDMIEIVPKWIYDGPVREDKH